MLHSKIDKEREAMKADKEAYLNSAVKIKDRINELEGDLSTKKYFDKFSK